MNISASLGNTKKAKMLNSDFDTVYIAGPMSGLKGWNYENFYRVEEKLRSLGLNVLNPASNPKNPELHSWQEFMRDAINMVLRADGIVFLEGWEQSRGARLEMTIGQALGLAILDEDLDALEPQNGCHQPPETVCSEADKLVSGDRGDDYGHPLEDFSKTGRMWGAILSNWAQKTAGQDAVPPELVGLCMMALKISREAHKPKRDNRVDIAGYSKCVDMIQSKLALGAPPKDI